MPGSETFANWLLQATEIQKSASLGGHDQALQKKTEAESSGTHLLTRLQSGPETLNPLVQGEGFGATGVEGLGL